jgi:IMP dehydrogenase/GMP reductase
MATILKDKAIWFNDIISVPRLGKVRSRKEIPRELFRLVCSPMTAVVGETFAKEASKLGLTVVIPRFLGIEKECSIYESCNIKDNLYLSMGLNDLDRIKEFGKLNCENYIIDIASGYLPHIEETVKLLVDNTNIKKIILGNVTTVEGFRYLSDIISKYKLLGINRLGLSNGSGCQTYDATSFGSGQASEILEIAPYKSYYKNITIASDGGHRNGGTISKAFLLGADYTFIGGIFAKSLEAECHISGDSTYFGLASDKNQILSTGQKYRHSEGKVYEVNKQELKPLKDIVEELWGGISSAISYSGHKTLSEAIGNGIFQIKQNSLPPKIRN